MRYFLFFLLLYGSPIVHDYDEFHVQECKVRVETEQSKAKELTKKGRKKKKNILNPAAS